MGTALNLRLPNLPVWAILLALSCLLFLVRLGNRQFMPPDEPRFALIAQEMLRNHEFIVPHLDGEAYSNKPPLYLWLVALFSFPIGRVTEWSARLPSALAATGSVVLTFFMGRRLFGERAGLLGALILMTSGHFMVRGRWASTDMTLSFFCMVSLFLLYLAIHPRSGPSIDPAAGRWFFAAAAFATLTKGPVGLVLPIGILLLALAVDRRWVDLRRFPWFSGTAIYLLLVVPWYLLYGLQAGGEKLGIVVLTENVIRYFHAWNNVQPFYYYLLRFPLSFLPWSLFLPAAAVALVRRWRSGKKSSLTFLVIWFAVVFLFFSISSGKRTVYLLPLFPAAAMLVGWFLDRGVESLGGARSAWARGSALALALFLFLTAATIPVVALKQFGSVLIPAAGIGLVFAISACLAVWAGWKGKISFLAASTGTAMILAGAIIIFGLVPEFNRYQNVRELSARIVKLVPPGSHFAVARKKREAFFFYTGLAGEPISKDVDLVRILNSPEPAYCLLLEPDWDRAREQHDITAAVLLREPVSHHTYVLVSNEVTDVQ